MTQLPDIPSYSIERELGRGGMATVYLARQESLDREVALKVMKPALSADEEFSERFVREARTAASLRHPGIVAIYDAGVAEHSPYMAMEIVEGGDLKHKLRDGALSSDQAVGIVRQLAAALAYAHGKGFVHRDVKPENILFREDGSAVLTDFGIARAIGSGTRMTATGLSIGTPHYMSPEQARGRDLDGRSDLYALGVVFYEMLTGTVPFDAQDSFAVGLMHINETPPRLSVNLTELQPVIEKLLAKDPAERYQDGSALLADLDQLEKNEAIRPKSQPTRVVKRLSVSDSGQPNAPSGASSSWQWGISGGVLAVVLGVGIYFWQAPFQPPSPVSGERTTALRPGADAGSKAALNPRDSEPHDLKLEQGALVPSGLHRSSEAVEQETPSSNDGNQLRFSEEHRIIVSNVWRLKEIEVQAQRLTRAAFEAAAADPGALDRLSSTRVAIGEVIDGFREGNPESNAPQLKESVNVDLATLEQSWQRLDHEIARILGHFQLALDLVDATSSLSSNIPRLQAQSDAVVRRMIETGAPSVQIYVASRQLTLTERILRRINDVLAGGPGAVTIADGFSRDANLFGRVLEGLINGDEQLGLQAVRNSAVMEALTETVPMFEEVRYDVDTILEGAEDLRKLQAAAREIDVKTDRLIEVSRALGLSYIEQSGIDFSQIVNSAK